MRIVPAHHLFPSLAAHLNKPGRSSPRRDQHHLQTLEQLGNLQSE
jgi:hypothetical protein